MMLHARRSVFMVLAGAAVACPVVLAGGGGAAAGTRLPPGAHAVALAGTWHTAIEVPGTAALNSGGAVTDSVSCRSAGNCTAGGEYHDGSGHGQVFVASEVNGTWQAAIEVPGTAALNSGGSAQVNSVSCGGAGNCAAGGGYTDGSSHLQAFVASEVKGTWHAAIEVPGTATLNSGGFAVINWVSCGAAGNCAAGGDYTDGSGHLQAFVANET
jgi:hypothetical protein